ncbi:hypothetical protein LR48_Vigan04g031400 [Vigna angularis]|uniref:Uncharacterized protein n=1 Tax=Phaseolus angularis TaxID=3914 RepID=A0A0L9UBP1_PHAAN|nr:hypothetical protein LR48_Vigan04g031400 [Vigna angularis]
MPSAAQERSSQRGRSPRISGRSSRVEARAAARPERQKRTFVQPGRTLDKRRENWTFVQLAEVDVQRDSQWTLVQRRRALALAQLKVDARSGHMRAHAETLGTRVTPSERSSRYLKTTLVQPGRRGRSSSQALACNGDVHDLILEFYGLWGQRVKKTLVYGGVSGRSAARRDARPNFSGRSSMDASVDARQREGTLVHFQFFQRVSRPGAKMGRPGMTFQNTKGKWSLVLWRCDFTAGAHGGREELVVTSPPLPLGLLLLPSSMFVSFRVLHGNGEPNPSCWD